MLETPEVLLSAEEIDKRITEIAAQLSRDYAGKNLLMIGALSGAVIFMADLARKLTCEVEFDFIRTSSYGDASRSSGNVQLRAAPTQDLQGRHVLLVEDIVDAGHTLVFLQEYLNSQNPASLRICTLLDKPSRREDSSVKFDYLGFSIPDYFVVGYGLDYAQRYRNLPYVGIIKTENN